MPRARPIEETLAGRRRILVASSRFGQPGDDQGAYSDGIPVSGKPVPVGAMMARIERAKRRDTSAPYDVIVPGPLAEVSFMVKDSKRFPETNGWGYAKLKDDAASGTLTPPSIETSQGRTLCHNCHIRGAKARDYVYTSYAQR